MPGLPGAHRQTPSHLTTSVFSASIHNPFSPTPSACCNPPAGFSRLSGPCSVLPDGRYISPAATAGVHTLSAPLRYTSAVTPHAQPCPLPPVHRLFPYPTAALPPPAPDGHFPGHPMHPEGWPGTRRFYRGAGSGSGTTAIFYPPHQMPSAHWRAYPLRIQDDRYPEWHPTSI
ncbi:hypothetical protein BvCmsOUP014_01235 [Escherichia coli]|nr:hypothetical protein BvCmsOUP014_01235 [Escherichia coli]